MEHFGLSLEENKSRLIEFGRFAKERSAKQGTKLETFTFLGFTHYCSQSRNGRFRVKRKTSKKKFAKKCKEVHRLIGGMRTKVEDRSSIVLNLWLLYGCLWNRKYGCKTTGRRFD